MARQLLADVVRSAYPMLMGSHCPDYGTPIVVADDVATWLAADKRPGPATTSIMARFDGPLRMAPPMYHEFWVEGTFPAPVEREDGYRIGVFIYTTKSTRGADVLSVRTWGWIENPFGLQRMDIGGIEYYVDKQGEILAAANGDFNGEKALEVMALIAPWARWTKVAPDDSRALMALQMAEFAIATCAFAVCRNIKPETVDVPPKVARKRARALGLDEPTLSYSRIVLPGFREWRTASKLAAGAGAQELPGHPVRGHPKTFRRNADGSGGLGRYHAEGTWLWSSQWRGNPEHGERIPLVTVKPNEAPHVAT